MVRLALSILLSLFFVSGCVKIPVDEACCRMMSTPDIPEVAQGPFIEGDFPDSDWWEMFDDPQLSRLICHALAENPTLQGVEARVRTAEEEAKIKKSYLLPTLGFSADLDWRYLGENDFFRAYTPVIPANVPEYEIDVNFYYEFDFWGKNRNIYRAAIGYAKAEEAERQNAILALSTSVASVYFKLQAQLKKMQILKEERHTLTSLFELTKLRQEHALDNSSQLLNAEEQLFIINKNILFAEEQIILSKHMLTMLLGEGPTTCDLVKKISLSDSMKFPLPQNISSDLIARRPDLMAHIWRVEATAHLVGAAKADFYPRVNLCAFAGLDSVFFNKLFTWGSRSATVVPAFHLPIFTAGRLKANLRARQAEFEQTIFAYNEAVLRAVKEVADQIVMLKTADETLRVENRLVQNKLQNRKLMHLRYEHAISNLLELLDTQEALLQEEFKKIHFQYERYVAVIHLIKALGGGYCTEEVPFE